MEAPTKKWPGFKPYHHPLLFSSACVLALGLSPAIHAQDNLQLAQLDSDFTALSLEQLMNIEVESVSKRSEPLQKAAAAIYVLDGDTIRNSGVRHLAEALRLVPGIQVARVNAKSWEVTARGFNATTADKLEVLLDGRSLYTPLFSGVFWEAQDTLLEDIDRIEVIRGPGAALWGANAVNGVINIVTKSSENTQGGFAEIGGGGEFDNFASVRQGGKLGDNGHYRVYAKDTHYREQEREGTGDAQDSWKMQQLGFRSDWKLGDRDSLTVQGDGYRAELDNILAPDEETRKGFNLLSQWNHQYHSGAETQLQFFYERTEYDNQNNFQEDRDTVELDVQHQFSWGARQKIVLGGGYKESRDEVNNVNPAVLFFAPDHRDDQSYNLFFQDQINFFQDKVQLTVGVKAEENDYTGSEVQPSLRMAYHPDKRNTVWMGVSRAVRLPNRLDHNLFAPTVAGNENFDSEELIAYEAGFRSLLTETISTDLAVYYNEYDNLRGLTLASFPPRLDNEGIGRTQGAELVMRWQPIQNLSVLASYQYFDMDIHPKTGSLDVLIATLDEADPQNQAMLRSEWSISDRWRIYSALRWVDERPDKVVSGSEIVDEYLGVDLTVAWDVNDALGISLVGTNLGDSQHPESSGGVEIQRSVHGRIEWHF